MTRVPPRASIQEISAYVPGESKLPGFEKVIKLASNEAALGTSPKAVEAAKAATAKLHLYPDPQVTKLRGAIAAGEGMEPERLIFGPGSEYLLQTLMQVYAGPGDEVLFAHLSFPMYRIMALAVGATPVEAEAPNYTADVDALLAKVTPKTRIVAVANPNNPTGTWIPRAELKRLREGLREDILLIVDSAYAEYLADNPDYSDGRDIVDAFPENTVMTRTFSKMYALANPRLGWGYAGREVVSFYERIRLPFCVTSVAEEAALAAYGDAEHRARELANCNEWRPRLAAHLEGLGYKPIVGGGNFVFLPCTEYKALDAHLRSKGIIVRPIHPANALRITVGTPEENRLLMEALDAFAAEKPAAASYG